MSAFAGEASTPVTVRDFPLLRRLVRHLLTDDPSIGLIRHQIAKLPEALVRQIEATALSRSAQVPIFRPLATDLLSWARNASAGELVAQLRLCLVAEGGMVPGRRRPNGKQSAPHFEARIAPLPNTLKNDEGYAGGRPQRHDLHLLISFLAIDWLQSTGLPPDKGRSDEVPFGALVFMVFRWIGEGDKAAHSLRTYWYPPKPRPKKKPTTALSQG